MKQMYTQLDDFEKWELDAFADGEDIPHLKLFLDENPKIQERFVKREMFFAHIAQSLNRFDCPSEEQLRQYYVEELSASEKVTLQSHLADCSNCKEELDVLRDFMVLEEADSAPEIVDVNQPISDYLQPIVDRTQGIVGRTRMVVATLLQPPSLEPALAFRSQQVPTLRGKEQTTLVFEAEDIQFSLMLQQDQREQRRIVGYILTPLSNDGIQCHLFPAAPQASTIQTDVDDTGRFVFSDIQAGNYQLLLDTKKLPIIIPNLLLA
ncbi:MAG: hypothetical protein AAF702_22410 [Chloroflexota bacterium]